jgi:hypothetical protein
MHSVTLFLCSQPGANRVPTLSAADCSQPKVMYHQFRQGRINCPDILLRNSRIFETCSSKSLWFSHTTTTSLDIRIASLDHR